MHGSNLGVLNAFLSEAFDHLHDLREILLLSLALFSPSGCPTKRSYSFRWKQHIKSGKPTNFNTFFCNQVDVRGLRCDITRKPFNSTLSKGKKSQLIYKERFYCVISLYTCRSEKLNKISSFRNFFPNREDFETSWCVVWRKPNASIYQKSTEWERIQNHIPRGQRIKSNMFQLSARAF